MIDLHIHTVASDGERTPGEIIKMAKEIGLSKIAITDHDSVGSVKEAIELGREYGINVIPGIEVTAYDNREIHVLGYNIDYESDVWVEYANYVVDIKKKEQERIFKTLNELGYNVTYNEVMARYSNGGSRFRSSYVAKWLFDNGEGISAKDAYNKFFLHGPFENIRNGRISVKEAIDIIHAGGGIAVFAHPCRLGKIDIDEAKVLIEKYKGFGLDGVEAIYCMHTDEQINELMKFCEEKRLKITMGSDYHGEVSKPSIKLGHGIENNLDKYQNIEVGIF